MRWSGVPRPAPLALAGVVALAVAPFPAAGQTRARSGMVADSLTLIEPRLGLKFEQRPSLSGQESSARTFRLRLALGRWPTPVLFTLPITLRAGPSPP